MYIDKFIAHPKQLKILIFLLVLILSSHYYYLYFIVFHEGVTHTPWVMQLVKITASILFYLTFFDFKAIKLRIDTLSLSMFFAIFILCYKLTYFVINDFLFINFFALSIPYIFFRPYLRTEVVNIFFPIIILILCLQITIDYFLVHHAKSIWENKAFIGGFGNPSTFGIICNIAIAYMLTKLDIKYHLIPLLFITYGACQTKSMATIAVLLALYLLNIPHQKNKSNICISITLTLISIGIIFFNIEGHLAYKILSLMKYFGINFSQFPPTFDAATPAASVSTSVTNRYLIYHQLFENFLNAPFKASLLGSFDAFYNSADSQFVTFSSSFGIFLSCLILYKLIFPFFNGVIYNSRYFSRACGLIFIIYCASNRILEYYPVIFVFIFLLSLLYENQRRITFPKIASRNL